MSDTPEEIIISYLEPLYDRKRYIVDALNKCNVLDCKQCPLALTKGCRAKLKSKSVELIEEMYDDIYDLEVENLKLKLAKGE